VGPNRRGHYRDPTRDHPPKGARPPKSLFTKNKDDNAKVNSTGNNGKEKDNNKDNNKDKGKSKGKSKGKGKGKDKDLSAPKADANEKPAGRLRVNHRQQSTTRLFVGSIPNETWRSGPPKERPVGS
jgi:hypothetical protein